LDRALEFGKGRVYILPAAGRKRDGPRVFSTKRACVQCGRGFEEPDPRLFSLKLFPVGRISFAGMIMMPFQ